MKRYFMVDYDIFWQRLEAAYPITKGTIKVPIVSKLLAFDHIDLAKVQAELASIVEQLIEIQLTSMAQHSSMLMPLLDFSKEKFTGVVRFDCVLDQNNELKILELNADYPDGLLMHDYTYSALAGQTTCKHLESYLEFFNPTDHVCVTYDPKNKFIDAYYLEHQLLARHIGTCSIAPVDRLVIRGNSVYVDGKRVDYLRRCVETTKISELLLRKLINCDVGYLNSFDIRTIGYKNLLANIASDLVPETFMLETSSKEKVLGKKDTYIVKPVDGCEGNNIYFGIDYTMKEWANLIEICTESNFLVQEYIDIQKCRVPLYVDSTIIEKELYFDFCPHFFVEKGKVTDYGYILMRFSENKVVNVSQGGGIGYYKLL